MALGAILIPKKLNCTDHETVEQIRENPYLQYFIGIQEYQDRTNLLFTLLLWCIFVSGLAQKYKRNQ